MFFPSSDLQLFKSSVNRLKHLPSFQVTTELRYECGQKTLATAAFLCPAIDSADWSVPAANIGIYEKYVVTALILDLIGINSLLVFKITYLKSSQNPNSKWNAYVKITIRFC